jgi:putative transposase
MKKYSTDLNDLQWQIIKKIQKDKRVRRHSLRSIWNAIFYIIKSGCQWRMLPVDYPPWQTVYYYFRKWKREGLIEEVHDILVRQIRINAGKKDMPGVGIIDSQSVKTTSVAGDSRGYDAGKKTKGRKRHIVVDTMGLILALVVHSASIQDRDGAKTVMENLRFRYTSIIKIFADGGYAGKLIDYVQGAFNWVLEIVKRDTKNFKVLPKRWIVERTFSWINNYRRNSKDYEYLPETSEAIIQLTMIRIMLNKKYLRI